MSLLTSKHKNRRSGVILVIVLGVTMVAAWLAIEVLHGVRKQLTLNNAPQSEARLRQTAYQLLEVSIGVLAEIRQFEDELYAPTQGWGFPLSYAGMEDSRNLQTAATRLSETISTASETDGQSPETDAEVATAGENPAADTAADTAETSAEDALLADLMAEVDAGMERVDGFAREITEVIPGGERVDTGTEMAELALPSGLQARVRLYPESGKLSLRATSTERWLLFFQEMGFEESESKTLTDSLLDWMDSDNEEREYGAEKLTYSQLDPPYLAPNRPLRDFGELRYVNGFKTSFFNEKGLPNENYRIFKNNVSLYHEDEISANSASELVLRTLAEEKGFEVDTVLNFLAGPDLTFGTEDDRILRPGLEETDLPKDEDGEPIRLDRPVRYIRAEISVSDGQSIFYLNSIIDLSTPHPGRFYPFKIIRIIENQPIS